ncbi:MAG: shikimate kinase, partial [Candidatus Bathyarchaeia archaeon]
AVLDPENRKIMRRTGKVIWLKAEGSLLYRRITNDPESRLRRPPLTSLDPHEEVNSVLREREPYYRETAHVILNTGNKSIDDVVEEIMCRIL